MAEFNWTEQNTIKRAKEFEEEAKKLRKLAETERAERVKREAAEQAVKILNRRERTPGTPEWMRVRQLEEERKIQTLRAKVATFDAGIQVLVNHLKTQGSIYNVDVYTAPAVQKGVDETYATITLRLRAR